MRFGFLSTHPPTQCGLATFNASLVESLTDDLSVDVVRVVARGDTTPSGPDVAHTWQIGDAEGWRDAADVLNTRDVAIIQHEYGIYPGADGSDVLRLMRRLTVPTIVVLHTVLSRPSARQKSVLEQVVAGAGAVVTMTEVARERLLVGYDADPSKISLIPHGAADFGTKVSTRPARGKRPHMLTWGLIGPGKGLEWAIRSLAQLEKLDPVYTIAGRTHPRVLELHGEAYRTGLHKLSAEIGVARSVDFQAVHHDRKTLGALIGSADVVVLPYDSTEQVTSGVLVEAVAAGVPVVATAFPHAVELLTNGPGLVVPHRNPRALATAVRKILTHRGPVAGAAHRTADAVPRWPEVADRYRALADKLVAGEARVLPAAALA